jgi:hypothetical protein
VRESTRDFFYIAQKFPQSLVCTPPLFLHQQNVIRERKGKKREQLLFAQQSTVPRQSAIPFIKQVASPLNPPGVSLGFERKLQPQNFKGMTMHDFTLDPLVP